MSEMMERIRMEFWRGARFSASPQGTKVLMSHQMVEDGIRAAIGAMRSLSDDITDAGVEAFERDSYHMSTFHCLCVAWEAMIDAALTPAPKT